MKVNKFINILIILALLLVAMPAASVGAAGTDTVKAANVGVDWFTNDTRSGGASSFVPGPGSAPLTSGSLQMTTTDAFGSSNAKAQLFNYSYIGNSLSDLDGLSYWTYRSSASTNSAAQTISLNIEVDYVGDGSSYTTLVFEPVYQPGGVGAMMVDTWQLWDAFNAGNAKWWSTRAISGVCATSCYVTWDTILTNNLNAKIVGAIGFNVGSGWAGQFSGAVDGLLVNFSGDATTYDFEPTPPDTAGPVTTGVLASLNPAAINSSATVTANVDDFSTGGSNIASAQYSLDNGATWSPMAALDGAFDAVNENVTSNLPSATPGVYDLCVRGTDTAGNIGEKECIMFVVYDPSGGFVTGGGWIWSQPGQTEPGYDSIPAVMPGSFASLGYQATSTDETGDHIAFAGTDRSLDSVTVSLTNWACENDFDFVGGTWVPNRGNTDACITTPGSGFNHPITLNIYEVDNSGPNPAVGALIASKTETFFIPFRPSWDSAMCADPSTDVPFGGRWYDPVLGACVHGYAFNIDFDFSLDGITLPDEVIYGVAYDTSHYGSTPLGVNGPYNSLNLSLASDAPSVGTDVESDTLFWDSSHGPFYCDGGTGGNDTFRRDAGCWAPYTPVVRFNVQTEGAYKLDPSLEGKATFGFVSKYRRGATVPDGNTEFKFVAGGLNFSSTSYQWLVVNQGGTNAQFKGVGTINGAGEYEFMLWAGDGSQDTFRIKIWYEDGGNEVVVYDNGTDQAIGGGSIVVHKR